MRRALNHLRRDPKLAAVIERVGPYRLEPRTDGSSFSSLVNAIVSQQLSTKAAATIHGRVVAACDGAVTDERIAALSDEVLRGAGLSRQKLDYMRDLSSRSLAGALPWDTLHELDDEAVIQTLTAVKGIGRWTVEMLLIFRMGRPDVLPVLDLGIRKAVQRTYRTRGLPAPKRVAAIGAPWAPYRSVASWYLWRSLEPSI